MKHQQRFPICFYHKIARKSFEKEVDKFFDNEDLIRRFGGADKIKPYKAFVKKHRDLFEMIDWHLLSKDQIKEVQNNHKNLEQISTVYGITIIQNIDYVC